MADEEIGFVNSELFLLWAERIFVPEIEKIRAEISDAECGWGI
jgi:hypothetical protein